MISSSSVIKYLFIFMCQREFEIDIVNDINKREHINNKPSISATTMWSWWHCLLQTFLLLLLFDLRNQMSNLSRWMDDKWRLHTYKHKEMEKTNDSTHKETTLTGSWSEKKNWTQQKTTPTNNKLPTQTRISLHKNQK